MGLANLASQMLKYMKENSKTTKEMDMEKDSLIQMS